MRRQFGLIGIGMLVIVGLAALPAAPAAASVAGWRLVSDTAEDDDGDGDASASVDCGDQWVFGSGFELTGDGSRYVILDELVPTLNTVTAQAFEYETGTGLDWEVTVWAVCGDPRGTHRTRWAETTRDSRDYKEADVACNDGTSLTGTGWKIDGALGEALVRAVVPNGNSVTAEAHEVEVGNGYGGDWFLRVYATCVSAPPGLEILSDSTSSSSFNKIGHRLCSAGKVVLGGGFEAGGPQGQINNVSLRLDDDSLVIPGNHEVKTWANELVSTTNNWTLDTYAICATE